jgi:hypothetical protein
MRAISIALLVGIAGCAFVWQASAAPAANSEETVLHSFAGGTDGWKPRPA